MAASDIVKTTIPVGLNIVKSVFFRLSALILGAFVDRLFAFIAAKSSAFTAHLLFAEALVQRVLFSLAPRRRFTRQGTIVLGFTVLVLLAGSYDQALWAIDDPGYIQTSSTTLASNSKKSILSPLKESENTVLFAGGFSKDIASDLQLLQLEQEFSRGLFRSNVNATITSQLRSIKRTVPPNEIPIHPYSWADPRIHLQDDGFHVALESFGMAKGFRRRDVMVAGDGTGILVKPTSLTPWRSLGVGSETVASKEVITLTRNGKRYVLLLDTLKVVIVKFMDGGYEIPEEEIRDLLDRTDTHGSMSLDDAVDKVMTAQKERKPTTIGENRKESPFQLTSRYFEYIFPDRPVEDDADQGVYANFSVAYHVRCVKVTLTLLMTEEGVNDGLSKEELSKLPSCPTQPNMSQDLLYTTSIGSALNVSTITCEYLSDTALNPATQEPFRLPKLSRYLVNIDHTASAIFYNLLSRSAGTQYTSHGVYSPEAAAWLKDNDRKINNLLLARSFISALNRTDLAYVMVSKLSAGLSYLQVILILVPVLALGLIWLFTKFIDTVNNPHYSSSLLMTLLTTNHSKVDLAPKIARLLLLEKELHESDDFCKLPPGYFGDIEDIVLQKTEDGHVAVGIKGGGIFEVVYKEPVGEDASSSLTSDRASSNGSERRESDEDQDEDQNEVKINIESLAVAVSEVRTRELRSELRSGVSSEDISERIFHNASDVIARTRVKYDIRERGNQVHGGQLVFFGKGIDMTVLGSESCKSDETLQNSSNIITVPVTITILKRNIHQL
ncbi:hypothetical protein BJ508DRAFT_313519 [Ascobolus immersus RN42]|uniref:Uncharacterized protein n=1 Tax=Ascobolus immersus RN42 TaxID=1160509 RepID=A0A3N4HPJ6_ASCIM|nr:hypothetical protein BJ508DRAFT_313519 [Ascobolus immersus RN42]